MPMDSAKSMDSRDPYLEAMETQCRSDLGSNDESFIQKGFIGKFQGKSLFYEVWFVNGDAGTVSNYIILRTDTTQLDSFDICLPRAETGSYPKKDTVIFKRAAWNAAFYYDSTLNEDNIPTLFQILNYGEYGYQNYYRLNIEKDQRIYLKGNTLYIQHWVCPRYDVALLCLDSYRFNGRKFIFNSLKIRKRVRQ